MKTFRKIIKKLTKEKLTIATMESCTGGGVANAITSIEGASEVLKYSAVTYSNEYKIKMGVNKETIDKYSVYSIETAHEMAFNIAKFAKADIGVGITGKLNRADENNNYGEDNEVFISIFDKENQMFIDSDIKVYEKTRELNKKIVLDEIISSLSNILGIEIESKRQK
jgi:PncC family amidohydrolase